MFQKKILLFLKPQIKLLGVIEHFFELFQLKKKLRHSFKIP